MAVLKCSRFRNLQRHRWLTRQGPMSVRCCRREDEGRLGRARRRESDRGSLPAVRHPPSAQVPGGQRSPAGSADFLRGSVRVARAKIWVRGFHERGTSWGAINNLADIPYFAAMKESRLLQIADIVAHAVWLLFERHDAPLVRRLLPCFDQKDGALHGLVHVRMSASQQCECPACYTRRVPWDFGPWV